MSGSSEEIRLVFNSCNTRNGDSFAKLCHSLFEFKQELSSNSLLTKPVLTLHNNHNNHNNHNTQHNIETHKTSLSQVLTKTIFKFLITKNVLFFALNREKWSKLISLFENRLNF